MADTDYSKLHVLVIDDEFFMRTLIIRLLKEIGTVNISTAGDGAIALGILSEAQPYVDLILLDISMPKMGGFEFINHLRNDFEFPVTETPIVIISGLSNKESLDEAAKFGITQFLLKPITPQQLKTRINSAFRHRFE